MLLDIDECVFDKFGTIFSYRKFVSQYQVSNGFSLKLDSAYSEKKSLVNERSVWSNGRKVWSNGRDVWKFCRDGPLAWQSVDERLRDDEKIIDVVKSTN